jgi:LEA14-like dessication related protein
MSIGANQVLRLAALLVLAWTAACSTLGPYQEPLRVNLVSIQPLDMTLLEQRYVLLLRIQNPNDSELSVNGVSFDLDLNGKEFANGVSGEPFVVPAFGEQVVSVNVVSTLFAVVRQVQELQSGELKSLQYRLSGRLSLAKGFARIPFERTGELDLGSFQPRSPLSPDGAHL